MKKNPILLGVNIDHVATLRQARKGLEPDLLQAALQAEAGGADGITVHLREDRRHIQDHDVAQLKRVINTRLNLEMAAIPEMLNIALEIKPTYCCIVPEKRIEITTEGGLDVLANQKYLTQLCEQLKKAGIQTSFFIDADLEQIKATQQCGAPIIEIHTGTYAEAKRENIQGELKKIITAAEYAHSLGLIVNAGHGLHYQNVQPIAAIPHLHELNIGHSIVSKAIFVGMKSAVSEMKQLMNQSR